MKTGSITYNGKNSLTDLGIYVTGSGSFDAAELDVDRYEVAGRNGDIIIPKNRYKNIPISYPAFIPKGFDGKVQSVRNWLRSAKTYARLEDTYDMNHYRLGLASGIQSFEPANRNDASNFALTFDCKPQRFLKTGETESKVEVDSHSYTGDLVSFDTIAEDDLTTLKSSIVPIQSLNGYDHPWAGGAGKNKGYMSANNVQNTQRISFAYQDNGCVATASGIYSRANFHLTVEPGQTYTISFKGKLDSSIFGRVYYGNTANFDSEYGTSALITNEATYTKTFTATSADLYISPYLTNNSETSGVMTIKDLMVEKGSLATAFEPYENLCPITGHDSATLWDDPKYGGGIEWNQLARPLTSTYYNGLFATVSWGDTTATATCTTASAYGFFLSAGYRFSVVGHKYFVSADATASVGGNVNIGIEGATTFVNIPTATKTRIEQIQTATIDNKTIICYRQSGSIGETLKIDNLQCFDLTAMFGAGNEPTTVEQFRALFPKDYYAYNAGEDSCVSKVNGDPYREYPVSFPQTVYGGTFDWVSGGGQSKMASAVFDGTDSSGWTRTAAYGSVTRFDKSISGLKPGSGANLKCNQFPVGAIGTANLACCNVHGNSPTLQIQVPTASLVSDDVAGLMTYLSANNLQVVYELAIPVTIDLTPAQAQTLLGLNNLWSDCGEVTVGYADPFSITNPTEEAARPLFRLVNPQQNDVISLNGKTITISTSYTGEMFIDCESMDAFSSSGTNLNSYITATDFPVLKEGLNIVTFTGSGDIFITPRWWEL